jgi:hypothetical protein
MQPVIDPRRSPQERYEAALHWYQEGLDPPYSDGSSSFGGVDALVELTPQTVGKFIPALDMNFWYSHCRKAYTFLIWVRPRVIPNGDDSSTYSTSPQVLYRISSSSGVATSANPASEKAPLLQHQASLSSGGSQHSSAPAPATCQGIVCTIAPNSYRVVSTSAPTTSSSSAPLLVQMSLVVTPLFDSASNADATGDASSSYTHTITLQNQEWQLIGLTHTFPYLKRPQWTCTVNGQVAVQKDNIPYPTPMTGSSTASPANPVSTNVGLADVTVLSGLGGPILASASSFEESEGPPKYDGAIRWDFCSLAFFGVPVAPRLQALIAEAGPTLSCHRVAPWIPAIPNATKGSTLTVQAGPKVGIPLSVHPHALALQRLSALELFTFTALHSRRLGTSSSNSRLVLTQPVGAGTTEETPKVGLVSPTPAPVTREGEVDDALFFGDRAAASNKPGWMSSAINNASAALLPATTRASGMSRPTLVFSVAEEPAVTEAPLARQALYCYWSKHVAGSQESGDKTDFLDSDTESTSTAGSAGLTRQWSALWQSQHILTATVLPFFLSLCPAGQLYVQHSAVPASYTSAVNMSNFLAGRSEGESKGQRDRQTLYRDSLRHLVALYQNDGALTAMLIRVLAKAILLGGARVHEEVLQHGLIHILASGLRNGLWRATKAQIVTEQHSQASPPGGGSANAGQTAELSEEQIDEIQKRLRTPSGNMHDFFEQRPETGAPPYIPEPILHACIELLVACTGPPTDGKGDVEMDSSESFQLPAVVERDVSTTSKATVDSLSAAMQIRRTSDLALTAVFGFALDSDLWGSDSRAAYVVYRALARRYGGMDVTAGYILRSQISVQFFLDTLRLRYDGFPSGPSGPEIAADRVLWLHGVAQHLSQLLQVGIHFVGFVP